MALIDSKKVTENFCDHHGIMPTGMERKLIELAILEGAMSQMKLDIKNLKKKYGIE